LYFLDLRAVRLADPKSITISDNSFDIGLVHVVALDLNPGKLFPKVGTAKAASDGSAAWSLWNSSEIECRAPEDCHGSQGAWLEQDLAAANANRVNVPWILVTSHYPLAGTMLEENLGMSADHYLGREQYTADRDGHFAACKAGQSCATVGDVVRAQREALIPILEKYRVDVYDAGHVHSYEASYPMSNMSGTVGDDSNPNILNGAGGIVYITEGNGGVPGLNGSNSVAGCTFPCRKTGTGGAYGRFITHNASVLMYEHVENPSGRVTDSWALVKG